MDVKVLRILAVASALAAFAGCGRVPLDLGDDERAGQSGSAGSGAAGKSGTAGQGSAGGSGTSAGVDAAQATAAAAAIASDATGTKLVLVGGGIWTSSNGGTTWIERAPSGLLHIQAWTSVASDSTGTKLVAVVSVFHDRPGDDPTAFSGDVWTSTDSGVTWTDNTTSGPAHGQQWKSVASDESGTRLIAATAGLGVFGGPGAVWTSTDAGVTWTNRTAAQAGMDKQSWSAVASDETGEKLVAVGPGSGIWTSTDAGMTWMDHTPDDPKFQPSSGNQVETWHSVASDATGTHLVATVETGDIWTSTNGGITWTDVAVSGLPFAVASDSTGARLVSVGFGNDGHGDIWTSTNGGLTWVDQAAHLPPNGGGWGAVASNAAGDHRVAVARGAIWID